MLLRGDSHVQPSALGQRRASSSACGLSGASSLAGESLKVSILGTRDLVAHISHGHQFGSQGGHHLWPVGCRAHAHLALGSLRLDT